MPELASQTRVGVFASDARVDRMVTWGLQVLLMGAIGYAANVVASINALVNSHETRITVIESVKATKEDLAALRGEIREHRLMIERNTDELRERRDRVYSIPSPLDN